MIRNRKISFFLCLVISTLILCFVSCDIWDIETEPYQEPDTYSVDGECIKCQGTGEVVCDKCKGKKKIKCKCKGDDDCNRCRGRGKRRCYKCQATGKIKCDECKGTGKIYRISAFNYFIFER